MPSKPLPRCSFYPVHLLLLLLLLPLPLLLQLRV
jgi:hypothetical protein